jgi:two-component system cell cycle response regulator DivK
MEINEWQVLVVEDEYDSFQMVSKILTHYGVRMRLAENGEKCLQILEEGYSPHLIIMDLSMPVMDGFETLTHLRANSTTATIPVVAVTAYYSDEVGEQVDFAGFDGYFRKPLNARNFIQDIAGLVKGA